MSLTAKQLDFLRLGYRQMRLPQLTAAFNKKFQTALTETAIKSTLTRHKWRSGRAPGFAKGERLICLTHEQDQFIRERYREVPLKDVLLELNEKFGLIKTLQQLKTFTNNHDIRAGRTGQFEKGNLSWNVGVKGYMGPNVTSFKKGNVPPNRKPVGTERIDSKDGYIQIKVAERNPYTGFPTRYKLKHIVIWERSHGPVPAGHTVVFKDGKKLNCELENLMLITRAELLRLNQYRYHEQPPEIKPTVLALAKLDVKTFAVLKNGQSGGRG